MSGASARITASDEGSIVEISVRSRETVRAQRRDRALLVAGELQVDVQLDAGVLRAREVGEALVERRRRAPRDVLVVVREQQRARCRRGARAARRTRSCRRAARAPRRKLSSVLPCARWWAPLCPTRLARRAGGRDRPRAHRWHPGHHDVGRLSSPWPRTRIVVWQRGQGLPGAAVDALTAHAHPVDGALLHARAHRVQHRENLVVGHVSQSFARDRPAPPSRPRISTGCRCPRPFAGRAARRRSAASDRLRAGARRIRCASNSAPRMSGPRPAIRGSRRVRESVISSSTGPSNSTTSCSPRRITSQARRACRRQRRPRS